MISDVRVLRTNIKYATKRQKSVYASNTMADTHIGLLPEAAPKPRKLRTACRREGEEGAQRDKSGRRPYAHARNNRRA